MPQRATISDVAALAQVSISTVSRVLNDTVPVDEETRLRVLDAVKQLSYVPHAAARTLASRKTNTIGLLLLDIGGEFYTPMLRGIEAVASEAGYDLLIHSTRTSRAGLIPRRALGEHNTDGLLVFTDALDTEELTRLNEIGFPVVLMHQTPPSPLEMPCVTIENKSGAQRLVSHLITEHGCRRIVFLRGPEHNEDSREREKGYRAALKEHGIPIDPELILNGEFETATAHAVITEFLARNIPFDAVFSGDDDSAVGVMQAFNEAGFRVPENVALVGFDDSIFARLLTPTLTTVRAPIEQVGREAARQLIHLIRSEVAEGRTVLPVELILRQSCGCKL